MEAFIEWSWYKTLKYPISPQNTTDLQKDLTYLLVIQDLLSSTKLFEDSNFYYIQTSQSMVLSKFLKNHDFKEFEIGELPDDFNLLYGQKL